MTQNTQRKTGLPDGAYDPKKEEPTILSEWLDKNLYKPEFDPVNNKLLSFEEMKADSREPWALVCPPPNAYARPHLGNISGYAYMDAMARYQRMQGKKVLVLPGKDHAGLEGEGVFVREVLEKQKRRKFDMKREDFYAEMMEFFMNNIETARKDEKEIGLSADYDRDIFTLDPKIVDTVLETFVEMYKKEMIYKGIRIVNWDPKARTAVADNQIEYKDADTPFYYFKYSIGEPDEFALKIKTDFAEKNIKWEYQKNHYGKDKDDVLPYFYGEIENKEYINLADGDPLDVIGFGYSNLNSGDIVEGEVKGLMMQLDKNYNLIVKHPDLDEAEFQILLKQYFLFYSKLTAGAHPILFDEYPEDSAYTNGFVIGTVRPETIFADTAIACDPKDKRYAEFAGKEIEVEFLGKKKKLNFISDYAVDKDFGTGLLKITPAHSVEDWEIANRNEKECLPPIQVIGYDLKMNHLAGEYEGMKIKEAREKMREDMEKYGNLVFVDEEYKNRIMIAERTKAPIEPLLSSQWYLNYDKKLKSGKSIKEAAIEMVQNDEVTIHPENMEKKFDYWMENLRDWAISRSLWWGYRLPVWYNGEIKEEIDESGQVVELINQNGNWTKLEYDNPEHLKVQLESPGENWIQDENVLDTWFSSGQWVYATLSAYDLMDTFFPTDVLVSAHDILENWDSRMMMFTYFKEKDIPFKNLFLTGLVKGTDGQKMSKSRGNVLSIDELREQYGTDAVRMAYFYQNSAGAAYAITHDKMKNFKQFMNKIWNASRFVLMNSEDKQTGEMINLLTEEDIKEQNNLKFESNNALMSHIEEVKKQVTENIEQFQFGLATYNLYQAFWHEFADVHIESAKEHLLPEWDREKREPIPGTGPDAEEKKETASVLIYVLKEYLKMLHPFIPFVTERIWKEMPKGENDHEYLMYSKW